MTVKVRADLLLVARGLADSRSRAQALIAAGKVESNGRLLTKPGEQLAEDSLLQLRESDHPWVSRGGIKLGFALRHFGVDPTGKICLDLGASTGGFTDVLLARGAARIYAVDVGHGQLHPRLSADPRVVSLEGMNARFLAPGCLPEKVELLVCDASFISLRRLLPAPLALVKPGGRVIALIKPQFELGREAVGKRGVVRDPALHAEACRLVTQWLEQQPEWRVEGLVESPITGPQGNREFFLTATKAKAKE